MVLIKIELLLTLTMDHGKALAKIHSVTPKGFINLFPAIKIAHLALKHRNSKNHKTRIIEVRKHELMIKKQKARIDDQEVESTN